MAARSRSLEQQQLAQRRREENQQASLEASRARSRRYYRDHPVYYMLYLARVRAARYGLEITITEADIAIPSRCPVLGIELKHGSDGASSPTLDRIIPERGYVPGNVHVVSRSANSLKKDRTIRQLFAGKAGPEWQAWAHKNLQRPRRTVTGKPSKSPKERLPAPEVSRESRRAFLAKHGL